MKKTKQEKFMEQKAQTAIEYMLLLTICALIVFASFKTFFEPDGRVGNGLDLYFNKVSNSLMGPAPSLPALPPPPDPCGSCPDSDSEYCGTPLYDLCNTLCGYGEDCPGGKSCVTQGAGGVPLPPDQWFCQD